MNELFKEAREHVDSELADTEPVVESSEETPTDEAAAGSARAVATDYSDIDSVVDSIAADPDSLAKTLKQFKRHIDGKHGTDISKLQEQIAVNAAEVNGRLKQMNEQNVPTDEPDEHGLTRDQYDELGKILDNTPQRKEEKEQLIQTQSALQLTQATQAFTNVSSKYGEFFTPKLQRRAMRSLRASGFNWNDPNVLEDHTEIFEEMNDAIEEAKSGKIQKEGAKRSEAQRKVSGATEKPGAANTRNKDISIEDEDGNATPQSMMKAAQEFARTL
jgi:hypothetical protein